ncbi:hypothetical protein [Sediminibacillus albus]|uniref:LPXTG-motif cell wall anchor domain-containing protein n=1 Tax=Sediminibacillus albus TaxID=407036 RepID=A0A1G8ZR32_9BACI|nr:hypothetical protein [Sediminibacillus albus]SDK17576.1 hypothetical protein SAMN05216243_2177 [Sediminibacillus albus]
MGLQHPVSAEDHGKPPVEDLEKQFNDLMNLETTENGEVVQYDSKARLEQEFKGIMVWPLADHFVDTYFKEENDKLYMREIDGPYKLNTNQDYTLEKISDTKYKLTQEGANQLRGEYTLTINYSFEAGKWVFADRMDNIANQGGEMPETATSLPTVMVSGGVISALGIFLLLARRRYVV